MTRKFFFFFAIVALTHSDMFAQAGIKGPTGPPANSVSLKSKTGKVFRCTADASGKFTFENIPKGIYDLFVTSTGDSTQRLALRAKPSIKGPTGNLGAVANNGAEHPQGAAAEASKGPNGKLMLKDIVISVTKSLSGTLTRAGVTIPSLDAKGTQ